MHFQELVTAPFTHIAFVLGIAEPSARLSMVLPVRAAAAAVRPLMKVQQQLPVQQFGGAAGSRLGFSKSPAYNLFEASKYQMDLLRAAESKKAVMKPRNARAL